MRKIFLKTILSFSLFLLINLKTNAQEINLENLINKTWLLEKYEENGEILPPKESAEEEKLIFYKDKSTVWVTNVGTVKGTWSYDEKSKNLAISYENNEEEINLKIIRISESKCIFTLKNEETGNLIKVHLYLEK
ncbi:hypothetical protein NAT51_14085 [Flavobacterium amniphilum]|uniref:hypothetical protein n=1 Tax=Flavobacterium amniphilum TaxID=1834035 RepID=UPI00202A8C88|nr:hypothetical protein [Flavobacterium amniphilum]MCL9806661.1 hypothetical protein [Flavobacterium amniphilum]